MVAAAGVAAAARGSRVASTGVRVAGDKAAAMVVVVVLKPQGLESLCIPRRERGFESPLVLGVLRV